MHYSPDQYGNPVDGVRFYEENFEVKTLSASQEVFFTKVLIDSHMAELQHAKLQNWYVVQRDDQPYHYSTIFLNLFKLV